MKHERCVEAYRRSLPALWWLNPWSIAVDLNTKVKALLVWGDKADRALGINLRVMNEQADEIQFLRQRVRDLDDAITRGSAIIPDAEEIK